MSRKVGIALLIGALLAAPALVLSVGQLLRPVPQGAYTAPEMEPLTVEDAQNRMFELLPALLLEVYDAFGRVEEQDIYDTLAAAAHGEALEALYLERAGAMVGGGLTEADQEIHEMRLKGASSRQTGETFRLDAEWEVIGTVGHSEHLHVRGNTYQANLTIAPVEGSWKIIEFELTDVDRSAVGEFIEADRTWSN
ncbi:MAG: hypothetical protein AAGK37_01050 [Pseudomonadota bacterium]